MLTRQGPGELPASLPLRRAAECLSRPGEWTAPPQHAVQGKGSIQDRFRRELLTKNGRVDLTFKSTTIHFRLPEVLPRPCPQGISWSLPKPPKIIIRVLPQNYYNSTPVRTYFAWRTQHNQADPATGLSVSPRRAMYRLALAVIATAGTAEAFMPGPALPTRASQRTTSLSGLRSTEARLSAILFSCDGVLVDSAAETALAGFAAAKALWPGAAWLTRRLRRPDQLAALVGNFEQIRPCLETGWESAILLHLLAEGMPKEDIMANFQSGLRDQTMAKLNVTKEKCNDALKQAREEWIGEDATSDDWLAAHGFYDGACQSVRDLLAAGRVEDVYVITTKAADFSKRLLQKQQLFGEGAVGGGIKPEHIYVSDLGPCCSLPYD